jgi:hypothetical protein
MQGTVENPDVLNLAPVLKPSGFQTDLFNAVWLEWINHYQTNE